MFLFFCFCKIGVGALWEEAVHIYFLSPTCAVSVVDLRFAHTWRRKKVNRDMIIECGALLWYLLSHCINGKMQKDLLVQESPWRHTAGMPLDVWGLIWRGGGGAHMLREVPIVVTCGPSVNRHRQTDMTQNIAFRQTTYAYVESRILDSLSPGVNGSLEIRWFRTRNKEMRCCVLVWYHAFPYGIYRRIRLLLLYGGRFLARVGPYVGSRGSTSRRRPWGGNGTGGLRVYGSRGWDGKGECPGSRGTAGSRERGWDGSGKVPGNRGRQRGSPPVNHGELGRRI